MKNVLKIIGAILFVGLMLAKASAFHIYEHQDTPGEQDSHCEFCILALENQQSDILFTPVEIPVEDPGIPVCDRDLIAFDLQLHNGPLETALFSRPPPSLLL